VTTHWKRSAIGAVWCIVAGLLLVESLRSYRTWLASPYQFSGPRDAIMIFAAFALAALVSGGLLLKRIWWAPPLVLVHSVLVLLYRISYIVFGGVDDTSTTYGLGVLAMAVLAVSSIAFRRTLS